MRILTVLQLILLFTANFALALPIANINRAVEATQDPNCSRRDQTSSYRDLIHLASVIGEDDRRALSRSVVRMSPAQAEQAMRCTGHIYCPNAENGQPKIFSAGSICAPGARGEDGKCAADRLATVAHGFINKQNVQLINNLAKCEFQNYRGFRSALQVSDIKASVNPADVFDAAANPAERKANVRADKTVVRLKNPIPGCDPYDVAKPEQLPARGDDLVAITYKQVDQTMQDSDGTEPLVYACSATRTFSPRAGRSGAFYSDCDVNGGGSGGFTLVRTTEGKFLLAGIFSGSGVQAQNGRTYDEKIAQHTVSVATNADFIQMAMDPGVRPSIQTGQGDIPTAPVARPTNN